MLNLKNKQSSSRLRDINLESESLIDLAFVLSQQNDLDEIFRVVAQKSVIFLNAEMAMIFMVNPRTHKTVKTIHKEGAEISETRYRSVQKQVNGWIMKNNLPLLSPDINNDPRFSNVYLEDVNINSVLGIPLKIEGDIIGSFILFNKKQNKEFDEIDLANLEKIAIISAPYLRNVEKLQRYFMAPLTKSALLSKYEKFGLIGKSKRFSELLKAIEAAARCDVRVILEGQSGTGKELVAQAIHKNSDRSQGPFVAIDCGAISPNLLESELFGHIKGAFTGAAHDRKGLIEEANSGTLFMDEIVNLPLEMQSKLMRMLQESEIRPVGSNKTRKVDVRIITAASESLFKLVEKKQFREDLFYRLYVYPISVPSLVERQEDVLVLARHFIKIFSKKYTKGNLDFSNQAETCLLSYNFPGNVRELENIIQRAVINTEGNVIESLHFPANIKSECNDLETTDTFSPFKVAKQQMIEKFEREYLKDCLKQANGKVSYAAEISGIDRKNLYEKMKRYNINPQSYKDDEV